MKIQSCANVGLSRFAQTELGMGQNLLLPLSGGIDIHQPAIIGYHPGHQGFDPEPVCPAPKKRGLERCAPWPELGPIPSFFGRTDLPKAGPARSDSNCERGRSGRWGWVKTYYTILVMNIHRSHSLDSDHEILVNRISEWYIIRALNFGEQNLMVPDGIIVPAVPWFWPPKTELSPAGRSSMRRWGRRSGKFNSQAS